MGEVIVDVERDVFPDMISLKRIMPSMTFGTPLPTYLRSRLKVDVGSREVFSWILKLSDELGFLPSIEEVRIEVGFSRKGFEGEYKRSDVRSLLEPFQPPRRRVNCLISTLEHSILSRLLSLSRPFSKEILPDLVGELCDLRMSYQKPNKELLRELLRAKRVDLKDVLRNVETLRREGEELYEGS